MNTTCVLPEQSAHSMNLTIQVMQRLLLVSHYKQKTNLNFLKCLTDLQFNFSNVIVPHNLFRNFKSKVNIFAKFICTMPIYQGFLGLLNTKQNKFQNT